jgi:hypothetical protein
MPAVYSIEGRGAREDERIANVMTSNVRRRVEKMRETASRLAQPAEAREKMRETANAVYFQ